MSHSLWKCSCDQSWQLTTQQIMSSSTPPSLPSSPPLHWKSLSGKPPSCCPGISFAKECLPAHGSYLWHVRQLAVFAQKCHVVRVAALAHDILTMSCYVMSFQAMAFTAIAHDTFRSWLHYVMQVAAVATVGFTEGSSHVNWRVCRNHLVWWFLGFIAVLGATYALVAQG